MRDHALYYAIDACQSKARPLMENCVHTIKFSARRSRAFLCRRTRLKMQLPVIIHAESTCGSPRLFFPSRPLFSFLLYQSSILPFLSSRNPPSLSFSLSLAQRSLLFFESVSHRVDNSPPSWRWFRFILTSGLYIPRKHSGSRENHCSNE